METLSLMWQQIRGMQWSDYLDIILVAFLIYKLLPLFRSTGTMRIAWVVGVIIVVASITDLLELHTLSYLFSQVLAVGLLALVVLFQPELRRMIDHLTNMKLKNLLGSEKPQQEMVTVIAQTVHACEVMSRQRIGALIVFARDNRLDEYFKTGTMIEGRVSEQLIRNVFFPKAALHDGAMIIRDGLVTAAGCVLPLSESDRLSLDLGTRHRAAVGMSEVSDAVVVVVSEETGVISVAVGGVLKRQLAPQTLEKLLRNELCPEDENHQDTLTEKAIQLYQKLQKKDKGGKINEK
ncbi:MAG: diadenylate cyclase CdaA [Oscillospiraceae bacterium]|nr:diadenylate cyclase CdaA [Oscillospiraceae bacterium]